MRHACIFRKPLPLIDAGKRIAAAFAVKYDGAEGPLERAPQTG